MGNLSKPKVIRNRCKIDTNQAGITNWGKIITNWGSSSYYKSGQNYYKLGQNYCKSGQVGQLLQINAEQVSGIQCFCFHLLETICKNAS